MSYYLRRYYAFKDTVNNPYRIDSNSKRHGIVLNVGDVVGD